MALASTTNSVAIGSSDLIVTLASTTALTAIGMGIFVDGELLQTTALPSSNGTVAVRRGQGGSPQSAHAVSQTAYVGTIDQFYGQDPDGKPPTVPAVTPWINVVSNRVWTVVSGAWSLTGGALPAGVTPGGSTTQIQFNNAGAFGGDAGLVLVRDDTSNAAVRTVTLSAAGTTASMVAAVGDTGTGSGAALLTLTGQGGVPDGQAQFSVADGNVSGCGVALDGIGAMDVFATAGSGITVWDAGGNTAYVTLTNTGIKLGNGMVIRTAGADGYTALFQALDVDAVAFKTFATLTDGNTPTFVITPPSGGTVTVNATTLQQGGSTITLGGALTFSGAFGTTITVTGTTGVTLPTSGTLLASGEALGTPSSGTLTNCTLPVGGVTGLGTGVGAFLATPSSANLITAITDETGGGALVFANTPTLVTPVLGAATGTSVVLSGNCRAASYNVGATSGASGGPFTAITGLTVVNGIVTAVSGT